MFGKSVKRKEDPRLIQGLGKYVDDISLPGLLHMAIVRSPHAHAKIKNIDVRSATQLESVVAAFTAADLEGQLGSLPAGWVLTEKSKDEDQNEGLVGDDPTMKQPDHPPLATEFVRYVGDAVAVIVATDSLAAADAAELVNVDYEPLPAIVAADKAALSGAPQLHEDAPNNLALNGK